MARTWAELTAEELLAIGDLAGVPKNTVIFKDDNGLVKGAVLGAAGTALLSNGETANPSFGAIVLGTAWGNITGTLSSQIDLQNELDGKEDISNKSTDVITDGSSDIKYPSVKAIKDYADSLVVGLLDYRGAYDASVNTFPATGGSGAAGAILKGDMWIISVAGTLGGEDVQIGDSVISNTDTPGQTATNWDILNSNIAYVPEDVANKKTDIDTNKTSDTFYASCKSIYDWATGLFVDKTSAQTIAGVKTFSLSPIVPAPTTDLQAATKKYVDDNGGGGAEYSMIAFTGNILSKGADWPILWTSVTYDTSGSMIALVTTGDGKTQFTLIEGTYIVSGAYLSWDSSSDYGYIYNFSDSVTEFRGTMVNSDATDPTTVNSLMHGMLVVPSGGKTYELRSGLGRGALSGTGLADNLQFVKIA